MTTNIMQIALSKVEQNNLVANMSTLQQNCFVILSHLVTEQWEDEEPALAYETIKKWHRENPDDLYWELLNIILDSPLFPVPMDWQDYIAERTEELDYVIYKINFKPSIV